VQPPLVSIVISAYNRPSLLKAALDSALAQTYPQLEFIVQDDSTNENCAQVVRDFADSRIYYTHNTPSLGTADNLLAGYRKARGKYFCTLNDDDLYAPQYIASMVSQLENNPAITVAFSDHFMIDGAGAVLEKQTEANTRLWQRDKLSSGTIVPPFEVALVRKSIPAMFAIFRRDAMDLDDFPREVASGYDFWLSYLAVRDGLPIYYSAERLAFYRTHLESQTAGFADPVKRLTFARYSQYTHTRFLEDQRLQSVHASIRAELARDHAAAGFALLRLGRNGEAATDFRAALRCSFKLAPVIGLFMCAIPATITRRALRPN
jgi:glycosyltransferase involved in cell wall biosynthesis